MSRTEGAPTEEIRSVSDRLDATEEQIRCIAGPHSFTPVAPHVADLTAGAGEVASLLILEATNSIGAVDGVAPVMEHLRQTARTKYDDWFPTVAAIQPPALLMKTVLSGRGRTLRRQRAGRTGEP